MTVSKSLTRMNKHTININEASCYFSRVVGFLEVNRGERVHVCISQMLCSSPSRDKTLPLIVFAGLGVSSNSLMQNMGCTHISDTYRNTHLTV